MKSFISILRQSLKAQLLAAALVALLCGCAPSFTFGTSPNTDQLRQLQRGTSTSSDVRSILGEPRGKGETRIPIGYRTLWLYDAGEIDGSGPRSRILYLIVFFDGETYDGFLWFNIDTKY
jgi:hypothetical protein